MSDEKRVVDEHSTDQAAPSRLATSATPMSSKPPTEPSAKRKWLFRLVAVIGAPLLALGVLELGLWLFGFGYPTAFFLDGASTGSGDVWIDNSEFGRWVFPAGLRPPAVTPFEMPKRKAPGTFRIFVIGESAAMGFPDPSCSFARALEAMLRARYPGTRCEVINASMVAINSHVALPIARQCLDHEADLLVVHLGNNEVIGPFGAAGVLGAFAPSRGVIQANLAIKRTHTGQLFNRLVRSLGSDAKSPKAWKGMGMFVNSHLRFSDPRLETIYAHHRANLEEICQSANAAGVPVLLCTIPVNLKDSAPFASLHAVDLAAEQKVLWEKEYQAGVALEAEAKLAEALGRYQEAERIDGTFADLAFRIARCHAGLAHAEEAQKYYSRARDLDALRFRSDGRINQTIREVAAAHAGKGVGLVDAERSFALDSPGQIPGATLFLEHVHMTFAGNYRLGKCVFEALAKAGLSTLPAAGQGGMLTESQCAERLAHTEWDQWRGENELFTRLLQEPPFTLQLDHAKRSQQWKKDLESLQTRVRAKQYEEAVAIYQRAVQATPDDWMIRMKFADLLVESGKPADAVEHLSQAVRLQPHHAAASVKLGLQHLNLGDPNSAEKAFREAIRIDARGLEAQLGLATALECLGQDAAALKIYEAQIKAHPESAQARQSLGKHYLRIKNLGQAQARFAEALERDPENPTIHVDLGVTAFMQEKVSDAIGHIEAALRLQPDWPEVQAMLAQMRKQRDGGAGR